VDKFSTGLLKLTMADSNDSEVPYKIGVMGVVVVAGEVSSDDEIKLIYPPVPHKPMTKV
jgi:MOSC domain-containing protein YiiM